MNVVHLVELADEMASELLVIMDAAKFRREYFETDVRHMAPHLDELLNRYEEARADIMFAMTKREAA